MPRLPCELLSFLASSMSKNGLDYFSIQKTRTKAGHHPHLCRPACLCGVDLRVCVVLTCVFVLCRPACLCPAVSAPWANVSWFFRHFSNVQELCIHLSPFPWHCVSLLWALILYLFYMCKAFLLLSTASIYLYLLICIFGCSFFLQSLFGFFSPCRTSFGADCFPHRC